MPAAWPHALHPARFGLVTTAPCCSPTCLSALPPVTGRGGSCLCTLWLAVAESCLFSRVAESWCLDRHAVESVESERLLVVYSAHGTVLTPEHGAALMSTTTPGAGRRSAWCSEGCASAWAAQAAGQPRQSPWPSLAGLGEPPAVVVAEFAIEVAAFEALARGDSRLSLPLRCRTAGANFLLTQYIYMKFAREPG
jgi:hypothetical protein